MVKWSSLSTRPRPSPASPSSPAPFACAMSSSSRPPRSPRSRASPTGVDSSARGPWRMRLAAPCYGSNYPTSRSRSQRHPLARPCRRCRPSGRTPPPPSCRRANCQWRMRCRATRRRRRRWRQRGSAQPSPPRPPRASHGGVAMRLRSCSGGSSSRTLRRGATCATASASPTRSLGSWLGSAASTQASYLCSSVV